MPISLAGLVPEFASSLENLIAKCKDKGYEMRPNNGLRTPLAQAKLWRQSRSIEEITAKIDEFKSQGALFLANCIATAGPQHGDHATNAPPGFSWHQWGEAMDCFWVLDGKAEWSTTKQVDGANAYHVFADIGSSLGLTPGGHWPKFKDWPHVQLSKHDSPAAEKSLIEIDDAMKKKFDLKR